MHHANVLARLFSFFLFLPRVLEEGKTALAFDGWIVICYSEGHLSRFNIEVSEPPVREFINITLHFEVISLADFHLTNTHQYSTIIQEIQVY